MIGGRAGTPWSGQTRGGAAVTFNDILSQTIAMLQQHGRVSYRALKRQFAIDDDYLEDLKEAILFAHSQVIDEGVAAWSGPSTPRRSLSQRTCQFQRKHGRL